MPRSGSVSRAVREKQPRSSRLASLEQAFFASPASIDHGESPLPAPVHEHRALTLCRGRPHAQSCASPNKRRRLHTSPPIRGHPRSPRRLKGFKALYDWRCGRPVDGLGDGPRSVALVCVNRAFLAIFCLPSPLPLLPPPLGPSLDRCCPPCSIPSGSGPLGLPSSSPCRPRRSSASLPVRVPTRSPRRRPQSPPGTSPSTSRRSSTPGCSMSRCPSPSPASTPPPS